MALWASNLLAPGKDDGGKRRDKSKPYAFILAQSCQSGANKVSFICSIRQRKGKPVHHTSRRQAHIHQATKNGPAIQPGSRRTKRWDRWKCLSPYPDGCGGSNAHSCGLRPSTTYPWASPGIPRSVYVGVKCSTNLYGTSPASPYCMGSVFSYYVCSSGLYALS